MPNADAEPSIDMAKLTGDYFPCLPKAYEKSVVLGGARVLYPVEDPAKFAEVLREHTLEIARRAFQAGRKNAKEEIRNALF